MTLLSICQTALREIGDFAVPTTIVGNNDPNAVQMLALANRAGRTLANDYRWQALLTNYTFPTVASTDSYALPNDFGRFANLTQWDNTNTTRVQGPVTPSQWQFLQSSGLGGAAQFDKAFRIAGGLFYIYPTPTAADTIAFQYYSRRWITGKEAFSADTDEALIDEDLILLGTKYRFLAARGDSYEREENEYLRRLDSLQGADGGRNVIAFGKSLLIGDMAGNLPETNFG